MITKQRKLAYVETVKSVSPIPNADKIEVARVRNWNVVIKKGELKEGDKCVYFEIDSFLPVIPFPLFDFLRKSSYKKDGDTEGFVLKTMRFKGVLSQGLIMPLDVVLSAFGISLPSNVFGIELPALLDDGFDLTELLNVKKYEKPVPACLGGEVLGNFPSFIPKTDEERIQNINQEFLENMMLDKIYVTEKIDGTSITVYIKDTHVGVCGRNYEFKETTQNSYNYAVKNYKLREKLLAFKAEEDRNIALQGELIGPGIQGNHYNLNDVRILWFSGYDIDKQKRMDFAEFQSILDRFKLTLVPIVGCTIHQTDKTNPSKWIEFADGKSKLDPSVIREGIVVRSQKNPQLSFKAVSNKYLLKYDI